MAEPRDVLERYSTVAVVGMSRNHDKAANSVPRTLKARGFRIIPVHPKADEIAGEPAYPSLADIPEPVEIVEVFRPASEAPDIARQAVDIGAKALWLQLGLWSPEAREIAESAGLDYVENHCMGVESAQLHISKG
jgi:uncharacterized protein